MTTFSGGAGGKGTWGKITEVFGEEVGHTNDVCDPNYDSEDEQVSFEYYLQNNNIKLLLSFVC